MAFTETGDFDEARSDFKLVIDLSLYCLTVWLAKSFFFYIVTSVNIMKAITENATYLQMMTVDKSATGDANAALAKLKKREQVGVFFNLGG